jgi:quinol monooxygenase YgiN
MVAGRHGNVCGRRRSRREVAVFAVTRLRAQGQDGEALAAAVAPLLAALAARPGFRDGELGRSADDPSLWALVTRWDGVGTYRRALSAAEVKIAGAPVWVHALDEPGAYLPVDDVTPSPRHA